MVVFFFFSSRRRHTRCGRDWSSDVCSSDLVWPIPTNAPAAPPPIPALPTATDAAPPADQIADPVTPAASCGGWSLQINYGDRWAARSSWWEYKCTSEYFYSYNPCSGGGARSEEHTSELQSR